MRTQTKSQSVPESGHASTSPEGAGVAGLKSSFGSPASSVSDFGDNRLTLLSFSNCSWDVEMCISSAATEINILPMDNLAHGTRTSKLSDQYDWLRFLDP